jgi:hypothetical protein
MVAGLMMSPCPAPRENDIRAVMNPAPAITSALSRALLLVLILPIAGAFVIAACLSAGPSEAFKAMFRRK